MFNKNRGIEIARHYEARDYIVENARSEQRHKEIDSPSVGPFFFQTTAKLIGPKGRLREGVTGSWHSFLPSQAYFLGEQERQLPDIHFVDIGYEGKHGRLAFEARAIRDLEVVACGLFKYLYGDYTDFSRQQLLTSAQNMYIQNQQALEQELDQALNSIIENHL